MKKICLLTVLFLSACLCRAYEVQYDKTDSLRVVSLIDEARKQNTDTNYVIFFARKLLGIPYVAHTLDVNRTEKLVVNLRQLDCTTYVESIVALYLCMIHKTYSFKAFCDNLCEIRYRGGSAPHYTRRLHYFTEWIEDNSSKGFCREIQTPDSLFTSSQKVNVYYMSANPSKYKMLRENSNYLPEIAEMEKRISLKSYRYIPKAKVANSDLLRKTVKDGDIIALTTSLKGLDIQHIGFAIWHKDGLHLLNASSLRRRVVEETQTLYNYLQRQRTMTGMRIVRLLP